MTTDVEPELPRVEPGIYSDDNERDGDKDRPQLNVEHIDVEVRPHGTDDRGQYQQEQEVPTHAMVLPQRLRVVDAAKDARNSPHQKPEHVLHQ